MIAKMIFDLLAQTKKNIETNHISSPQDVRKLDSALVSHSQQLQTEIKQLRQFLREHFYNHTNVVRMDMKSQKVVEELFEVFMSDWRLLPDSERKKISPNLPQAEIAGIICTYIANMTDMGALDEHQKLFDNMTRF